MNNKQIIALDQGSSSSRTLAFDIHGNVTARASRAVDTVRPAAGLAEFDAGYLLQGQMDTLQEVFAQISAENVAAIAVACVVIIVYNLLPEDLRPAKKEKKNKKAADKAQ